MFLTNVLFQNRFTESFHINGHSYVFYPKQHPSPGLYHESVADELIKENSFMQGFQKKLQLEWV